MLQHEVEVSSLPHSMPSQCISQGEVAVSSLPPTPRKTTVVAGGGPRTLNEREPERVGARGPLKEPEREGTREPLRCVRSNAKFDASAISQHISPWGLGMSPSGDPPSATLGGSNPVQEGRDEKTSSWRMENGRWRKAGEESDEQHSHEDDLSEHDHSHDDRDSSRGTSSKIMHPKKPRN